jgi:SAM-dependent methyltransferase
VPTTAARPCPACLSESNDPSRELGSKDGFCLHRCPACGTVFTERLPAPDEGADYGDYYNPSNLQERPLVRQRLGEVVASLERYRRANRWLDVGFGAGTLMQAANDAGWNVAGTEVAPAAAESVRALGFEVHLGDLSEIDLPKQSFDVISFVEVLEHVRDPSAALRRGAELLRRGGALYLTTPHGCGISARALGVRWSVMAPPDHLQLFSVKGIRSALERAELRSKRVQTHAVNPHERPPAQRVAVIKRPRPRGQTGREPPARRLPAR